MEQSFIHLNGICLFYGKKQALKDVCLDLQPGRIGLLGPNGAGKSSLLKILLGLLAPSSGRGSVLGHSILPAARSPSILKTIGQAFSKLGHDLLGPGSVLRQAIGYMSEGDFLIPGLQGAEFVALAGELYGMPRKQALRRAHEVLTYLGLEDARYRRLEQYSTGMKQRLKLAQALVHDPPVLLLDEPTSGLDPEGRDGMLKLLVTLGKDFGKSFLLCTHLLNDVERVCHSAVILHHGQVLRHGVVQDLCQKRKDRYRLQIQGDAKGFLHDLQLEGVRILHDNGRGEIRTQVPAGWVNRGFFVLAENNKVTLRGLQQDDEDLEEMFHRVLDEEYGS